MIRTILHQNNNLRTINPYDNRYGGYIVSLGPKNSGTLRLYRTVKDIAKSRIVISRFCCSLSFEKPTPTPHLRPVLHHYPCGPVPNWRFTTLWTVPLLGLLDAHTDTRRWWIAGVWLEWTRIGLLAIGFLSLRASTSCSRPRIWLLEDGIGRNVTPVAPRVVNSVRR
jgi:hypothetical protein